MPADFSKQTIRDLDFKGQTVLLRTDYNVPLDRGRITNNLRIRASLPTLEYLLSRGAARIIIISHLGKPHGQPAPDLSLAPVVAELSQLLGHPVAFCPSLAPAEVAKSVQNLPPGGILLLENLRFDPREEENSADFARELVSATGATLFVQDGFAVVHRAHASTSAVTALLPSAAGFLLENEVANLSKTLHNPEKPFVVIIGGAKVADKSPLIEKFATLADRVFVGGKIAADGYASTRPNVSVATDFVTDPSGAKLDVAPAWVDQIITYLESNQVKTVLWNGTLGQVEQPPFAASTQKLATYLGTHPALTTIICGGDTSGFVENLTATHPDFHFTLISTGGGASLEILSGLPLPGLDSLQDRRDTSHR